MREVSCKHEIFRCDEQCELHTAFEARVKEETASRAELSDGQRGGGIYARASIQQ